MKHLHLEPISTPEAVTWCGVKERTPTWPYVKKCERPVVGRLSSQDMYLVDTEFDMAHPEVCQLHADRIDAYLTEVLN